MNPYFLTNQFRSFATNADQCGNHLTVRPTSRSWAYVPLCLSSTLTPHRILPRALAAVLLAGLAATATAPSRADIVMTTTGQFREVVGQVHQDVGVEQSTLDGTFDESVSATFVQSNLTMNASASQLSQTPNSIGETITGSGSVAYSVNLSAPVGSLFARSDSFFTARFTVDATEEYLLSSFVEWNGTLPVGGSPANNRSIVTLHDNFTGQQLVQVSRDFVNQGSLPADHQVLLQQGRNYVLTVHAQTFGDVGTVASGSFAATASWEIHFAAVPVLGDVNLDGVVNLLDVDPFIDRIVTGDYQVEADTNQDGAVNLLDVAPFLAILTGG